MLEPESIALATRDSIVLEALRLLLPNAEECGHDSCSITH